MLSQEQIQEMYDELVALGLNEKTPQEELEEFIKLCSGPKEIQPQIFIDIASTTTVEDETERECGELGRYPQ